MKLKTDLFLTIQKHCGYSKEDLSAISDHIVELVVDFDSNHEFHRFKDFIKDKESNDKTNK